MINNNRLPESIESEYIVLDSLMKNNSYTPKILEFLKAEHFSDDRNKWLFKYILTYADNNEETDMAAVLEDSKNDGIGIDGLYLSKMLISGNPLTHANRVYENYKLRQIILKCKNIIDASYKREPSIELLSELDRFIKESEINAIEEVNFYDMLELVFEDIKQRKDSAKEFSFMSSYFPSLNRWTGGFRKKEITGIVAKDKQGKTTLALTMCIDFVINSKLPCGIFSLEMARDVLAWKVISLECDVDYLKLRNPKGLHNGEGKLSDEEFENIMSTAHRKFANTKLYFSDTPLNERQIRQKIKQWRDNLGIEFIAIDYLGLVSSTQKHDNREREIAYLSRFFKLLAKELDVHIVLISQLNREGGLAESLGLFRDCDYAFSIKKPFDEGIESVKIENQTYPITENDFIIKYERNRHGQQSKQFIAGYTNNLFREKDLTRGSNAF